MIYPQYHEGSTASLYKDDIYGDWRTSCWTTLHMCCFFAKPNVSSALLFLLTPRRNYGQNRLAEWNVRRTCVGSSSSTMIQCAASFVPVTLLWWSFQSREPGAI